MLENPLQPPKDTAVLTGFLRHFRLPVRAEPRRLLGRVARAFARLPYENLTKIIKHAELGGGEGSRRTPHEVVTDHATLGTGGTCFSLTATLLLLVRSLGFRAEPILADRGDGANTHCALVVWIDGRPHLLDPGYLIVDPVPLETEGERRIQTAFNRVLLSPQPASDKVDLHTVQQGRQAYRLTFKTSPADAGEFLKAWDASFDWDMMRYPLLTRVAGDKQLYLHGSRFQVRRLICLSA